ncbi:fibronectin type III domain protein [Opisthorchis viverrini]|uniref:Fibronectin type III domain protein n=1 Tax=Opisthorchis viverrini TaxID=6198 RepID=A0A1S8X0X6_OPIVI|nr:fibronectin type III domain protein [Opisthorchis viverrini]
MAVPNQPTSIRTITTSNTPNATVLWEYDGACPIVDFNVSVHKTDGHLLKSLTGTSRSAEFTDLPVCLPLYAAVQGRNQLGAGLQTKGSEFTIEGIPHSPNLPSVAVTPNVTRATVSWAYDGTCTTTDFVVNVYNSGGSALMTLNTIERSKEISPLPVCVELVVGVLGNNKIGSGPQKNSSTFSIASVPSAPKSVQATTVSNVPSVTASWDYDGACPITNFRISVYKPGGSSLKTLESSGRQAVIDDLPTCTPLLIGVLGVNQIGSGPQTNSSSFSIEAVPSALESIDIVPSLTEAISTVSWKYEGQCPATEFRIEIHNRDGRSLKNLETTKTSIRIDGLPTCVPLLAGVLARNKIGPGPKQNSPEFMIDAVPNAPKTVRTIAVPNVAGVTASWDYDGKCTVDDFQVQVYNSGGTSITSLESGGRSKEIVDLPVCVPLVVGLLGRNKFGSGPQTNSSIFTIAAVPDPPKGIRATTVPNAPTATISWRYDGDCPVTGFQVVVHKPDGQALVNVDKSSRSAEVPDLPVCVPLKAGVLAQNRIGSGQQRNSTSFTIDAVPNPPKNIQTTVAPKVTSAAVLWEYDGVCSVVDFRVSVYNRDGSSLKTLDTEDRNVDIANLPTCVPLHIGVLGRNAFGSGQEIKSLPFTIHTVPSAPRNVRAQTTPNVSSLTVVWEYENECSTTEFQVSVQKADGTVLMTVNANGLSKLIDGMPFCIPLLAGVLGRNLFGDGPQSTSPLFSIDAELRGDKWFRKKDRKERRLTQGQQCQGQQGT